MTNEQIAARLREIASNLPNVADSEPICSALHEVANELEAQPAGDAAAFKNFHRSLCARFNYTHDQVDWRRDLVSLEEHIAKQVSAPAGDAGMQVMAPLDVFSHGPWTYQETGQSFTGAELNAEAFNKYAAVIAALQEEIAQLQQSRDTYFAERNSARDAYMKHRKLGEELQARINASQEDAEMLEWLLRNVRGFELRRIGVDLSVSYGELARQAVRAAMEEKK